MTIQVHETAWHCRGRSGESQVRTANSPHVIDPYFAITILRLIGHINSAAGLGHHAHKPVRPMNALLAS